MACAGEGGGLTCPFGTDGGVAATVPGEVDTAAAELVTTRAGCGESDAAGVVEGSAVVGLEDDVAGTPAAGRAPIDPAGTATACCCCRGTAVPATGSAGTAGATFEAGAVAMVAADSGWTAQVCPGRRVAGNIMSYATRACSHPAVARKPDIEQSRIFVSSVGGSKGAAG